MKCCQTLLLLLDCYTTYEATLLSFEYWRASSLTSIHAAMNQNFASCILSLESKCTQLRLSTATERGSLPFINVMSSVIVAMKILSIVAHWPY
jgi:hypothetical protein